jgi:hypothetical protein
MTAVEIDTNPENEFKTVSILNEKRAYLSVSSLYCSGNGLNETLSQVNLERKSRSDNAHNDVRVRTPALRVNQVDKPRRNRDAIIDGELI